MATCMNPYCLPQAQMVDSTTFAVVFPDVGDTSSIFMAEVVIGLPATLTAVPPFQPQTDLSGTQRDRWVNFR